VEFLIGRGANLFAATTDGITSYDLAFLSNHTQVADLLLSSYAKQVAGLEGRFTVHSLLREAKFLYDNRQQAAQPRALWVGLPCGKLPFSEFRKILHMFSEEIREYDYTGCLPIHTAIQVGAPIEVLDVLTGAFEGGLTIPNKASLLIPNNDGDLPVHIAGREWAPLETMRWLLEQHEVAVHPALQACNLRGEIPLQSACQGDAPFETIRMLMDRFPAARNISNHRGLLPIHRHLSSTTDSGAVEFWKSIDPNALARRTRTGMLPFHVVALENSDSVGVLFELLKGDPDALGE